MYQIDRAFSHEFLEGVFNEIKDENEKVDSLKLLAELNVYQNESNFF